MEPEETRYDWSWLDETFDKCHKANIKIILCTPTPTPPRWMSLKYPDILRIDFDGQPLSHGSRQHVSHTSPTYRRFSRQITQKLAERYGKHPALVAWQTDNEFLCGVDADFSPSAENAWHEWLKQKYATIQKLNDTWQTYIWSENYPTFESMIMPKKTPVGGNMHHPALVADWARFLSDTVVTFQQEQLDIIRKHSDHTITHNQIQQNRTSNQDLFAPLDFASTDFYNPHDSMPDTFRRLDWMRGAKMKPDGTTLPYCIMETSPSHNGATTPGHKAHPPKFLRAEAALFLAHGGNAFCYWLWRQQQSGVESCHGSVITAWGAPSVCWNDVKAVTELIQKIGPMLQEIPPAKATVALHESHNARAQFRAEPLWPEMYNPWTLPPVDALHKELVAKGIWRDVRFESADISRYKVVLSPFLPALSDDLLTRMEKFVRDGGTWVVGPMSGVRTIHATVPTDSGLGKLDQLAGVKSLYPVGLRDNPATLKDKTFNVGWYCIGLEAASPDTQILGRYTTGPAEGAAWATQRKLGKGNLILLTAHAPGHYADILETILGQPAHPRLNSSQGTTIIPREGNGKKAWIIANWDGLGGTAELPAPGTDILAGKKIPAGPLKLAPFEVLAIRAD
jgi:beta-galactosidase